MELTIQIMQKILDETCCDNVVFTPEPQGFSMECQWYHSTDMKTYKNYFSEAQCRYAVHPMTIFEEFINACQKITENINELGFYTCESPQLGYISPRRNIPNTN